jgi:hypothetical protein
MKSVTIPRTILLVALLSPLMLSVTGHGSLKWQSLPSGDKSKGAAASDFVGCYELKLGRWWPWSSEDLRMFHTPPSHVELLSSRGTDGFVKDHFLIGPVPASIRSTPSGSWSAYWDLESKN